MVSGSSPVVANEISRDACKLARTPMLIKKIKMYLIFLYKKGSNLRLFYTKIPIFVKLQFLGFKELLH
jgi:hypothetical protein